jgi:arylsulfatase A-like enzyme
VQAAVDDPENRKRAGELRDGLLSLADAVGTALDDAGESPHGQRVKEEFSKVARTVADASRKAADDVRPHLIGAAKSASERLREAAADLERRAGRDETTAGDAGGEPG